jgi:hypothetical protein
MGVVEEKSIKQGAEHRARRITQKHIDAILPDIEERARRDLA